MAEAVSEPSPAKQKRIPSRIYVDIREMIDPATGEEVGCLVPVGETDRTILRRKKCRVGKRMRTTVSSERDYGQHKYVHLIGQFVEANIEGFEGKDAHTIVKSLQLEGGFFCDQERLQIEGFEGYLIRKVPRSMAFDEMEETEFQSLVKQVCNHLAEKYLPTLSPEQVAEAIELMPVDPT